MHEQEQWRAIPGFPAYLVSDQGRVVSTKLWRGQVNRELRGHTASFGYPCVHLYGSGGARNRTARSIHSLVAEAFIGPRPPGQEVRHLDGDPKNCRLENLAYGTHVENERDKIRHGTNPGAKPACINNHPFDEVNTYVDPRTGRRYCRPCTRVNSRRYRARKALRATSVLSERAA